jgi:hypothetical protein
MAIGPAHEIRSPTPGGFDPNGRHDSVARFDELGAVLSNGDRRGRRIRLMVYVAKGTTIYSRRFCWGGARF